MAHKLDSLTEDRSISVSTVADVLIFKSSDIVSVAAKDVDWEYATRDTFQTDTAISRCNGNGNNQNKTTISIEPVFPLIQFRIAV